MPFLGKRKSIRKHYMGWLITGTHFCPSGAADHARREKANPEFDDLPEGAGLDEPLDAVCKIVFFI